MNGEWRARRLTAAIAAVFALALFPDTGRGQPGGRVPVTQPIPIPAASFAGDRPQGLFYRLKVNFTSGSRLEVQTLMFLAGNRFVRTYPHGGADTFDPSRCNSDMCGTYELGPAGLAVRLDNGQTIQWQFRKTADGFELDGDSYKPARALTAAALAGTWAGAATTGNSSENVYRFEPNGTFSFGMPGRAGVGGRYSLQGLTLTLAFSDGTQRRRTVFGASASDPIGLISVEGDAYRRQ
jgi:hypothetical protein